MGPLIKANKMCKSFMRKIFISSRCNFLLKGMSCITHDYESLACLCTTSVHSTLLPVVNSDVELDDVFVHVQPGAVGELRSVRKLITSGSPPRVIVLVDNTHVPTLKLLRAMGVIFIVSLRDALSNIVKLLLNCAISHLISAELQAVTKSIQPAPAWAESAEFDGVQCLTPMETEIILDLLQGNSPRQVARERCVSTKTVSMHKRNALKKMQLRGLNELIIMPRR